MTSRDFFAFAFGLIIVAGAGWTVSWLLAGFSAIWLVLILVAVPGLLRGAGAHARPARAHARGPIGTRARGARRKGERPFRGI